MTKFAAKTLVSPEKSRAEIESILSRYGATHFGYASSPTNSVIGFECKGRRIKFELPLPDKTSKLITRDGRGYTRNSNQQEQAYLQAVRQRWRALALCIKAKLEAVECGIATFEEEFLAHIILPNGTTVGNWLIPEIQIAYENRVMPKLLEM